MGIDMGRIAKSFSVEKCQIIEMEKKTLDLIVRQNWSESTLRGNDRRNCFILCVTFFFLQKQSGVFERKEFK